MFSFSSFFLFCRFDEKSTWHLATQRQALPFPSSAKSLISFIFMASHLSLGRIYLFAPSIVYERGACRKTTRRKVDDKFLLLSFQPDVFLLALSTTHDNVKFHLFQTTPSIQQKFIHRWQRKQENISLMNLFFYGIYWLFFSLINRLLPPPKAFRFFEKPAASAVVFCWYRGIFMLSPFSGCLFPYIQISQIEFVRMPFIHKLYRENGNSAEIREKTKSSGRRAKQIANNCHNLNLKRQFQGSIKREIGCLGSKLRNYETGSLNSEKSSNEFFAWSGMNRSQTQNDYLFDSIHSNRVSMLMLF